MMNTASSGVATIDAIVIPPAWVIATVSAAGTMSKARAATAGMVRSTPATSQAPASSSAHPRKTVPEEPVLPVTHTLTDDCDEPVFRAFVWHACELAAGRAAIDASVRSVVAEFRAAGVSLGVPTVVELELDRMDAEPDET